MKKSLEDRKFNIEDGERYFAVLTPGEFYFAGVKGTVPLTTPLMSSSKTYSTRERLENAIQGCKTVLKYEIHQVKDLMEPRYYIFYRDTSMFESPDLVYYTAWTEKGTTPDQSFIDFAEAEDLLKKYIGKVLEYHYRKIMELKDIKLVEAKKG